MSKVTMDSRSTRMKWRDVLDTVTTGASDVVVTRNSKASVAIIPFEDYEAIIEQLEEIRESRLADALIEQWQAGKIGARPWAALKASLARADNVAEGNDEQVRSNHPRTSREDAGDDAGSETAGAPDGSD